MPQKEKLGASRKDRGVPELATYSRKKTIDRSGARLHVHMKSPT